MWPAGDANYKFTGAFSRDATTVSHMPILYLMDNMSDVDSSATTAAKAASLDHATLAHEMEHAIADYYRNRGTVTKDLETAYDEGIAHLFEDAFGYGEENFSKYVQAFLSSLPDGAPFLVQSDSTNYKINAASSRGGANALMYYLALQAGGFTVTDGRPTSGTGMTAIVNMVKDTTHSGVASLTTNFSTCDWTTKIGTFIGSFFNDNRTGASSDQAFTLATYDGIKDLEGNANKTFGLRFNNFRSFTTVNTNTVTEVKDGAEVFHYATQPILVTTSAADAKVTVTAPAVENSAVTLIKLP